MDRAQRRNANLVIKGAVHYGRMHGWNYKRTHQNCRMALMTPMPESSMHNYASANVPESTKYPHDPVSWTDDGLGHDHASMGMYQQQTGFHWTPAGYGSNMNQTTMNSPNGWGTPKQLMNIIFQVKAFLDQMGREYYRGHPATVYIPEAHTLGERCQLVQGSAFPGRYQPFCGWAGRYMRFRFQRMWLASRPSRR